VGEDEARALAERLLADVFPRRWRHVQAVAAEAGRLCDELGFDRRVVVSAAWLHDIGYAPELADSGFHALDGARFLRSHRWDDTICCLVAHHTDAAAQAVAQGYGDTIRREFDEVNGLPSDVLWTADATTGPTGQRLTLNERIAEIAERYGADHAVTRAMIASRPALSHAIARVHRAATNLPVND
jgi:putative nucleotidyltransferase with HDIG domain